MKEGLGLIAAPLQERKICELAAAHATEQWVFADLMHTAKATAERAALIDLEVCPVTNACVLRYAVLVVANNFECVRAFGNEAMISLQLSKYIILIYGKPFATYSLRNEGLVEHEFSRGVVLGHEPPKEL